MTSDGANVRYAGELLDSCAHGLTSAVKAVGSADGSSQWLLDHVEGARGALHDAALGYAAAHGSPNADELAELAALRRFRDGIAALRAELTACSDLNLVKDTIAALFAMSFPVKVFAGDPEAKP